MGRSREEQQCLTPQNTEPTCTAWPPSAARPGKPIRVHKINLADVFHNDDLTFEQRRDAIVRRIRATTWFKNYDRDHDRFNDLPQFVEELADV